MSDITGTRRLLEQPSIGRSTQVYASVAWTGALLSMFCKASVDVSTESRRLETRRSKEAFRTKGWPLKRSWAYVRLSTRSKGLCCQWTSRDIHQRAYGKFHYWRPGVAQEVGENLVQKPHRSPAAETQLGLMEPYGIRLGPARSLRDFCCGASRGNKSAGSAGGRVGRVDSDVPLGERRERIAQEGTLWEGLLKLRVWPPSMVVIFQLPSHKMCFQGWYFQ